MRLPKSIVSLWSRLDRPQSVSLNTKVAIINTSAEQNDVGEERELGQLLGALVAKTDYIAAQQEEARETRARMFTRIEQLASNSVMQEERLKNLETSFSEAKPTIQEFNTWKARVQGAGWLGRVLWTIGGLLLAAASWLVLNVTNVFGGLK